MIRYIILLFIVFLATFSARAVDGDSPEMRFQLSIKLLDSNIDSAEQVAVRLLSEALDDRDYTYAGKAAYVIGSIYDDRNMWMNASMRYYEALEYLRRSEDKQVATQVSILKNLGRLSNLAGRIDEAILLYSEALKMVQVENAKAGILFNMGYAYYSQRQYEQALNHLFDAYDIALRHEDYRRATNCLNYMGLCFHYMEQYPTAREYFFRVLDTGEYLDSTYFHRASAWATHNIAYSYFEEGETDKALEKYLECLAIKRTLPDSSEQFVTLMDIGELKLVTGDTLTAIDYLGNAAALYSLKASVPETFKVFDLLERAHENVDRVQQRAYIKLLKHEWQQYDERQKHLKQQNDAYEVERIKQQIQERVERIERHYKIQRYAVISIAVISVVTLVGLWSYSRHKNNRKQKLRKEILDSFEPLV